MGTRALDLADLYFSDGDFERLRHRVDIDEAVLKEVAKGWKRPRESREVEFDSRRAHCIFRDAMHERRLASEASEVGRAERGPEARKTQPAQRRGREQDRLPTFDSRRSRERPVGASAASARPRRAGGPMFLSSNCQINGRRAGSPCNILPSLSRKKLCAPEVMV